MELIIFPMALAYFIWLHVRDRRNARLRAQGIAAPVSGTAAIERDKTGNVQTIFVHFN